MAVPTACKIGSNGFGGDEFRIAVNVDDADVDSLTVAATVTYQGQSAEITPGSRTISGGGTATFTLTVVQTNGDVTLTVSDGRGASASKTIAVGDDYTFNYCPTSG